MAALAAQECHHHCCLSVRQLVGQVVVLACLMAHCRHCHPHLSLRLPKLSSLSSVLWLIVTVCSIAVPLPSLSIPAPATQVVAVVTTVCPMAHHCRLLVVPLIIAVCPFGLLSSLLSRWLVEIVGIKSGKTNSAIYHYRLLYTTICDLCCNKCTNSIMASIALPLIYSEL